MTISTPDFARRLHDRGSKRILVRGRAAPTDKVGNVVTFDVGTVAVFGGDYWHLPLYVTTATSNDEQWRQFDTTTFGDAIEHAEQMLSEHAPDGVWLRNHAQLVDCLSSLRVGTLEARLADAATAVDATFVTWTGATTPANDSVYDSVVEP